MKPYRNNRLLLAAISLTLTAPNLHAVDFTWDAGLVTAGAQDGGGTWQDAAGNWRNTTTSTDNQNWANATDSKATFGAGTAGTYAINLVGTLQAGGGIVFNTSGYTLSGSALSLVNSATTNGAITVADSTTATINSAITYSSNRIANISVGTGGILNLGGGAGNSQYTFTGGGTVNMTAGTYTANTGSVGVSAFNQTGGTFNITPGNGVIYNITSSARNINYTLSGTGILTVNNNASSGTGTSPSILRIGNGTTTDYESKLTIQTGGTLTVGTSGTGKYGELQIAGTAASNGKFDVQGGAVTIGSNPASNQIYFFKAGADADYAATMTQSGGTVTTNGIQFGGTSGTYNAAASATLTLSGGSLYVGTAGISRGSAAGALPTTIQLQGGTLGADQDWSSSLDMKLGTTAGGPTIRAQNSASTARDITLSGILSNDGAVNGTLTKTGTGNLTLSNANTFTGATTISAGKILMTNASALQYSAYNTTGSTGAIGLDVTSGLSSGTLTLGGLAGGVNVATAITGYTGSVTGLVLNPQGTQSNSYSGVIANGSGAMTLTKTGDGTQELSGAISYTGTTTVNGGTLRLVNNAITASRSYAAIASVATLEMQVTNGGFKDANNISLTGNGTFKKTGADELRVFSGGSTSVAMGSGGLIHVAEGNFYFGGATSGNWTGNLADLQLDTGASFDARQTGIVIDALQGGGTLRIGTKTNGFSSIALTLGVAGGNGNFSGSIVDVTSISGNTDFSVVKTGAGTQTLSGTNNTYSGETVIRAGTLKINTSTTIGSSSKITVGDTGSSGTVLDATAAGLTVGASQTLAGIGIVDATGQTVTIDGVLAPGNSPGTLSMTVGTLDLANATSLAFELNPSDTAVGSNINDLVAVTGNLNLDGLLSVVATSGDFLSVVANTSWRLFNYSGTLTDDILSLGSMPPLGSGLSWSIDTATTGHVNLVVIPEPRAALLGGLGLLALLRRRRN